MGQIYGSIEAQHQRRILVDFIDHLADFKTACAWYYQFYYPKKGSSSTALAQPGVQGWKVQ